MSREPGDQLRQHSSEALLAEFVTAWNAGKRLDPEAFCKERGAEAGALQRLRDFVYIAESLAQHKIPFSFDEPSLAEPGERTLGPYRIVSEVGRGGMGVVYEAVHRSLGRRVALKVLPSALALQPEKLERFRREGGVTSKLKHPGIVETYGVEPIGDAWVLTMELVEGPTLDRIADKVQALGRWPGADELEALSDGRLRGKYIEAVGRVVAETAEALHYAHAQGVLHRDVKPSNIIIRAGGAAALLDFGLARDLTLDSLTASGLLVGTVHYLAPEMASPKRLPIDARADVYSLGVTLYELLTLRRPHDGTEPAEIIHKILTVDPPDAAALQPALPADLAAIVMRALEKDPARRYPSAHEFACDLRAFLGFQPITARRVSGAEKCIRWVRREPFKAGLAALAAACVVVPSAVLLSGYVLERGSEVIELRAKERTARVERELEDAFTELGEGSVVVAVEQFRAILGDAGLADGERGEALAGLALAAIKDGQPDAALSLLDRETRLNTRLGALGRIRKDAASRMNEASAAAEPPAPVADAFDAFVAGMIQLLRGEDGDAAAYQRAKSDLQQAVRFSPKARAVYQSQWLHAAYHAGDAATVRECAEVLRALWPDSAAAWFWIGFALGRDDADAKVAALEKSVSLDGRHALAYSELAQAYLWRHATSKAAGAMRRAAELSPQSASIACNLGIVLRAAGEQEASYRALERAVELDPAGELIHRKLSEFLTTDGRTDALDREMKRFAAARK